MTNAKTLLRLQEIDLESAAIRISQTELEGRQGESQALRAARDAVASTSERVQLGQKAQRERENKLDSITRKLSASQARLYSGTVQNPKELQGLGDEIEYLTQRIDELQDAVLEALIEVEEAQEALEQAESSFAEIENQWKTEQGDIGQELERLAGRSTQLANDRSALESQLEAADLELYNDLRRRKGPAPIAYLAGGACKGCGVSLPVAEAHQVRDGETLVFCSSCGRLLVAE